MLYSFQREIVSVTFGKEGSGKTVHSFRYKSVVPYILPKVCIYNFLFNQNRMKGILELITD